MSAILFLTSGGMASFGGDLPDDERKTVDEIVKSFGEHVRRYALAAQVPASLLTVRQSPYLLVAKDTNNYHFVFANAPGGTTLMYRNLTNYGRIDLPSIVHQIRIEVGEVTWAFSAPINASASEDEHIQLIAAQYVESVLQSQSRPNRKISDEAISSPEIASGLERFRADHPPGARTAFIMMQFKNTRPHKTILSCLKQTLKNRGISGIRADEKEYMDDLFSNIRTYMHGCDFGVAVFDRIIADDFNPNVSLEVGYMLGLGKNVLLLKDATLKALQTDLTGRLYRPFDTTDVESSMPTQVERWLADRGLA
jgi:hypothetical protein